MDSFMQRNEQRGDGLDEPIGVRVRELEEVDADQVMGQEVHFGEHCGFQSSLEGDQRRNRDAELGDRMNAEQNAGAERYQSGQQEYERGFQELADIEAAEKEKLKDLEKEISEEQKKMTLLLKQASAHDTIFDVKWIRAEGLARIIHCRQMILNQCRSQLRSCCFHKKQLEKEQAEYEDTINALNLSIRTTEILNRIREERAKTRNTGSEKKVIEAFLKLEFSTQVLETAYVFQNIDTCLHTIELIRCVQELKYRMNSEEYAPVEQKLKEVGEYINVVESVLWEYGLRIDFEALQIRKIDVNDKAFRKRRQAYFANGALRYYLGVKRYNKIRKNKSGSYDEQQQKPGQARVEASLSALEERLKITMFDEGDMRIMTSKMRSVGKRRQAKQGDEIRAVGADAQSNIEHLQVKIRFLKIYYAMKEKLINKLKGGAKEFVFLNQFVENYVTTNRQIYINRRAAEDNEAKAFVELKKALIRVKRNVGNKCARYAAILLGLLTEESSGYLEVPLDGIHVYREDINITCGRQCEYRDCTDMPLFTHRPNIKDIAQGGLGDCYLLAGLISVVNQNPEEIMNIMKDNGDGTVTVCFKLKELGKNGRVVFTPYYVTVKKTIPVFRRGEKDAFSRGTLWVKMMEKAYVASGMHLLCRINVNLRREGKQPQKYCDLLQMIEDEDKRLDYDEIRGGSPGEFISLLLGREREAHILEKNRADSVADRIGSILPSVNEPAWEQDEARMFGHERYDSIVYEYIEKLDSQQAGRFLNMRKPTDSDLNDTSHMESYWSERDKLQGYRRSCMLHLDIVDTLTKENNKDLLKLQSIEEINQWYEQLKQLFANYKKHIEERLSLDANDQIIERVRRYYRTKKFADCFSAIKIEEFNYTVDILKKRHLNLFATKNEGEQDAKAEEVRQIGEREEIRQIPDSYYTARERKLYERIEQSLQSGAYVSFGTRVLSNNRNGRNGESVHRGLVGKHAYALINTRKIMDCNHKERLYFVVANPWAELGLIYHVGEHGITAEAIQGEKQGEKEEGVFLLDLKTFAKVVEVWEAVPAKRT